MPPARPPSLLRTAATDPVLRAVSGTALVAIGWLLWGPGPVAVDVLLRAVLGTVFNGVLVVCALRLARAPGRTAGDRRFWRAMTAMGGLMVIGQLSRLIGTVRHPDIGTVATGRFQTVCVLAGIAVLVAGALTHPRPPATSRARLRYLLDTTAVVTAAVVVVWFVIDRSAALGAGAAGPFGAVAIAAAMTFAVTRLIVGGHSPISSSAAAPIVAAGVLQCFNGGVMPAAAGWRLELVLQIAAAALVSLGPRLQELVDRLTAGGPPRPRRSYSVLPYVTLGLVVAILPAVLPAGLSTTALVTLGGLLLMITVVVARQVLTLAENEALVRRSDAGLETLRRQEERVRLLLEYSTDITSLIDHTGAMTYLTPATRMLGYEPHEMVGVRVLTLIHPDDLPDLLPDLQHLMLTPGATYTYQARYRHAAGSWRWLEVTSRNLTHEPSVGAVVSNARDVTDARELQDRLRHEATHDALTGLANRVLFGRRLAAEVTGGVALLHIDLDGFKPINDTYGHHAGDVVLVRVAERLAAALPAGAVAARLGGDEFAALLPRACRDTAELAAEAFRAALAEPIEVDGRHLTIDASIGVVAGTGGDPEALLREADEAMYRIKHAGRR
ncbi:diguanylate cyclase domain-containing protein [Actinoplanes sp. NPDC049599]|uniref:diguanylate cyclase domain-containing protein n=1 Tax=Actinoplanes sp. NPDC049599 TaxID=3363903 RepID=UPI00379942C1